MLPSFKRRLAAVLEIPSPPGDRLGRAFDVFITSLIVANVAAVILETMGDLHEQYARWFTLFEYASLAVFGVEYAARLWVADLKARFSAPWRGRLRYALTPYAVVDLVSILPALLSFLDLRFLRVLRLFRLLKLSRYSESMQILTNVVTTRSRELAMASFVVMMSLMLTSSFMYYAEREAQPDVFTSIPAAMWWSIMTLTTTGYGDVVPVTAAGKALGGVTALLGVGVIALPVGILASGFVTEIEKRKKGGVPCPHCGRDIHAPPEAPATLPVAGAPPASASAAAVQPLEVQGVTPPRP